MKKPIPKIVIAIVGAVAAVIITLGVMFSVVLPYLGRVKIENFINIPSVDSTYNGYIVLNVEVDVDELFRHCLYNGKVGEDVQTTTLISAIDTALHYMNIDVSCGEILKQDDKSLSVGRLKEEDVLTLSISWDKSEQAQDQISQAQEIIGLMISQEDATYSVDVGSYLTSFGAKVKPTKTVDIVQYVNDNHLVYTDGFTDGELNCIFDSFELTQGDYKFTYVRGGSSIKAEKLAENTSADIKITIYVNGEVDNLYRLSVGDEVEFKISDDVIKLGCGSDFDDYVIKYTIRQNEYMSANEAYENVDLIADEFNTLTQDENQIESMYLLKKRQVASYDNIVCVIVKSQSNSGSFVYSNYAFFNCYLDQGKFRYAYFSTPSDTAYYNSVEDLLSHDAHLSEDKYYKMTKIG